MQLCLKNSEQYLSMKKGEFWKLIASELTTLRNGVAFHDLSCQRKVKSLVTTRERELMEKVTGTEEDATNNLKQAIDGWIGVLEVEREKKVTLIELKASKEKEAQQAIAYRDSLKLTQSAKERISARRARKRARDGELREEAIEGASPSRSLSPSHLNSPSEASSSRAPLSLGEEESIDHRLGRLLGVME
jgi:hypothetical protein